MKIHTATLALALLATGCGRTSGFLRDANTVNEHQFKMEIVAERYTRSVWGSSSITSVLCLVPIGDGAYRDAMAELNGRAKLQTNEVLENIREDHAFAAYIFVCTDELVISADVYQLFTTPESVPRAAVVRENPDGSFVGSEWHTSPTPPSNPYPPPPKKAPSKAECDPLMWPNAQPFPEQHPECPQPAKPGTTDQH